MRLVIACTNIRTNTSFPQRRRLSTKTLHFYVIFVSNLFYSSLIIANYTIFLFLKNIKNELKALVKKETIFIFFVSFKFVFIKFELFFFSNTFPIKTCDM